MRSSALFVLGLLTVAAAAGITACSGGSTGPGTSSASIVTGSTGGLSQIGASTYDGLADPCAGSSTAPDVGGAGAVVNPPATSCQEVADLEAGDVLGESNNPTAATALGLNLTATPDPDSGESLPGEYGWPGAYLYGVDANMNQLTTTEPPFASPAPILDGPTLYNAAVATLSSDGTPNYLVEYGDDPNAVATDQASFIANTEAMPVASTDPSEQLMSTGRIALDSSPAPSQTNPPLPTPTSPDNVAWTRLATTTLAFNVSCWGYGSLSGHCGNGKEYTGRYATYYQIYRLNTIDPQYDYFAVRATIGSVPDWKGTCNNSPIRFCQWWNDSRDLWYRIETVNSNGGGATQNGTVIEHQPTAAITQGNVTSTVGFSLSGKIGGKISGSDGMSGGKATGNVSAEVSTELSAGYNASWTESWPVLSLVQNDNTTDGSNFSKWIDTYQKPQDSSSWDDSKLQATSTSNAQLPRISIIRVPVSPLYDNGSPRKIRFDFAGFGAFGGADLLRSAPYNLGTYWWSKETGYGKIDIAMPELLILQNGRPVNQPLVIARGQTTNLTVRLLNTERTDWYLLIGTYKQANGAGTVANPPQGVTVSATHPFLRGSRLDYTTYNLSFTTASNATTGSFPLSIDTAPQFLTDDNRNGPVVINAIIQ